MLTFLAIVTHFRDHLNLLLHAQPFGATSIHSSIHLRNIGRKRAEAMLIADAQDNQYCRWMRLFEGAAVVSMECNHLQRGCPCSDIALEYCLTGLEMHSRVDSGLRFEGRRKRGAIEIMKFATWLERILKEGTRKK